MTAAGTGYALDNHHAAGAEHHRALADLLDAGTRSRIRGLPGWPHLRRCLEIGAGAGSMSRWLAGQVEGEDGLVVACDLKPELIGSHPRLATVGLDLTAGTRLVEVLDRGYDLILARMTLQHLPNRRRLLHELVGLLRPGGSLLVEDWAALRESDDVVICAPSPDAEALYRRYQRAVATVFDQAGVDRRWARQVHRFMREEGLQHVSTVHGGSYWPGGHPGLQMVATAVAQLRCSLLEAGLSGPELDQLVELTGDPRLVVHGHPLYSTSGTCPADWSDGAAAPAGCGPRT